MVGEFRSNPKSNKSVPEFPYNEGGEEKMVTLPQSVGNESVLAKVSQCRRVECYQGVKLQGSFKKH